MTTASPLQHDNATDQQQQSAEELAGNTGADQQALTDENHQLPPSNHYSSCP